MLRAKWSRCSKGFQDSFFLTCEAFQTTNLRIKLKGCLKHFHCSVDPEKSLFVQMKCAVCCVKPSPLTILFWVCFSFCPKRKMLLKLLNGSRSPASTANAEIENLEPQCADFCPLLFLPAHSWSDTCAYFKFDV